MSCKSLLYTVNSTQSSVAAGGVVPVGTITRRFGQSIRTNGNSYVLLATGYYLVSVNVSAAPVADTAITMTLNENGNAVSGGTATVLPAAAGGDVQLTLSQIPVRVLCDGFKTLTVTLNAAATLNGASITIEKA